MKNKKRKKLGRKMTAICGVFVLLLSITLCLPGIYTYYDKVKERYQQYAETIIQISDSHIDIGDMEQCIRTGEKSEKYQWTQKQLDTIKSRSDVEFLYVIKPLNTSAVDNAMYVWNAVTPDEREAYLEIASLGELSGQGFTGRMAEVFLDAMDRGDEVVFYMNRTEEFGFVLTGMYPLQREDGTSAALLCADISMNQIFQDILQYVVFVLWGTLIVGAIFLLVLLRLVNGSVVAPVIRMSRSAEDFVLQGNSGIEPSEFAFQDPQVSTGDEIQLLSESLKEMTSRLVAYMCSLNEATADRERISAQLSVATGIQTGLLPNVFPAFPERTEFDIYARLQVASKMSGDFYDFFLVDKNHLAVVIGDVNGNGVPAALLMVITQTLIRNYAKLGFGPDKVFAETNNQISESNEGMLTTAFLGILELTSGIFSYVNAGHNIPLLKRGGGEFEPLPTKDCFVLGSMAGVPYWQQSVRLNQGDLLFLYTKGLTEAENGEYVQYSLEHMHMRLNQAVGEAYELSEIMGVMERDLEEFMKGEARQQDITMVLLRYFGI